MQGIQQSLGLNVRTVYRWITVVGLALLLLTLIGTLITVFHRTDSGSLLGLMLFFGLIGLLLIWFSVRRSQLYGQEIAIMLNGQSLAHWTYSADEKQRFLSVEGPLARQKRQAKVQSYVVLNLFCAVSFTLLLHTIGLVVAVIVAIALLGMFLNPGDTVSLYPRRLTTEGVYIGRAGVYEDGYYTPLSSPGVTLKESGVPVLEFKTLVPGSRGSSDSFQSVRVAVPRECVPQAHMVIEHFAERRKHHF